MKKSNQVLLIVVCTLVMMFKSCGKDGSDGLAYLKFDWDQYVFGYWDNNPNVPSVIQRNTEYRVIPGTYEFEYYCSDDDNVWGYEGTYRIRINEGTDGSWFSDGDDGSNRYYTFFLSASGAQFNYYDKGMPESIITHNKLGKNHMYGAGYERVYIGEMIYLVIHIENTIIFVEKQKFVIK